MNRRLRRSTGMSQAALMAEPATATAAPADTFEELYRRAFPRVYAYVATLLRDRSAAEEVTAQAFERAYRKQRTFRRERGSADAWLFGIARNAALDELRRRKRRAAMEAEPEDAAVGAEEHAEHALRRETVRAALTTLEPRERDLVALKFSGGLSNAEIARIIGASESNAGTRLHRVIEKLRKACDADA
jgi:RNA polymerase sigma-70 factor, ECF subfamily